MVHSEFLPSVYAMFPNYLDRRSLPGSRSKLSRCYAAVNAQIDNAVCETGAKMGKCNIDVRALIVDAQNWLTNRSWPTDEFPGVRRNTRTLRFPGGRIEQSRVTYRVIVKSRRNFPRPCRQVPTCRPMANARQVCDRILHCGNLPTKWKPL